MSTTSDAVMANIALETWLRQAAVTTYGEAEDRIRGEQWTDDQWIAYAHVWRTSAPRFSDIAKQYERYDSLDPQVQVLADLLRARLPERKK